MAIKKIIRVFLFIYQTKKVWRKPKSAKVIIYDRAGSELFLQYLCQDHIEILDTRGESINIFILFRCLFKGLNITNYEATYIKFVSPDVAITFIDNNPKFYVLKNIKPNMVTVFVQNGQRSEVGDIFGQLEAAKERKKADYRVDHMLCFGNAVGQKYSAYISGNINPIGSFINNMTNKIEAGSQPNSVLFISQYRSPPASYDIPMFYNGDDAIYWDSFYSSEVLILPQLYSFCQERGLNLRICGCSTSNSFSEEQFFKNILGDGGWEYIPRSSGHSSYVHVDQASYIITIDTTLGYEALARGKKVATFAIRGKAINAIDYNFGWPKLLPDNGPFWTNYFSEEEFIRIMNYITTVTDDEWERDRISYTCELMEFDLGNTIFLNLMKDLQVPLNK
jgi:surface carbohydrate biosynthesis protein